MSASHEKLLFPMTKPDIPLTASRIKTDGHAAALPRPAMNSRRCILALPRSTEPIAVRAAWSVR
jgi:hypothetical protein